MESVLLLNVLINYYSDNFLQFDVNFAHHSRPLLMKHTSMVLTRCKKKKKNPTEGQDLERTINCTYNSRDGHKISLTLASILMNHTDKVCRNGRPKFCLDLRSSPGQTVDKRQGRLSKRCRQTDGSK